MADVTAVLSIPTATALLSIPVVRGVIVNAKFDADTRTRPRLEVTAPFDPTGSELEVRIDGEWYPAEWVGASSEDTRTGKWTQSARLVSYFAGPDAEPGDAVVLTRGRHMTKFRITTTDDVIADDSTPIDVD